MALTRTQKEAFVTTLKTALIERPIVVVARYKGLKVVEANELRKSLANINATAKVAKNSLLKIALKDTNLTLDNQELLDEPLLLLMGEGDQIETAKTIKTFTLEHPSIEVVAAVLEGKMTNPAVVSQLAALPSRIELEAKLVGVLAGTMTGLVNVLSGTMRGFVSVLSQYQLKYQEGA